MALVILIRSYNKQSKFKSYAEHQFQLKIYVGAFSGSIHVQVSLESLQTLRYLSIHEVVVVDLGGAATVYSALPPVNPSRCSSTLHPRPVGGLLWSRATLLADCSTGLRGASLPHYQPISKQTSIP